MFILSLLSTVNATHISLLLPGRPPQDRGNLVRQRRLDVPGARVAPLLGRRHSPGGSKGGVAATGGLHPDAPGGGVLPASSPHRGTRRRPASPVPSRPACAAPRALGGLMPCRDESPRRTEWPAIFTSRPARCRLREDPTQGAGPCGTAPSRPSLVRGFGLALGSAGPADPHTLLSDPSVPPDGLHRHPTVPLPTPQDNFPMVVAAAA